MCSEVNSPTSKLYWLVRGGMLLVIVWHTVNQDLQFSRLRSSFLRY